MEAERGKGKQKTEMGYLIPPVTIYTALRSTCTQKTGACVYTSDNHTAFIEQTTFVNGVPLLMDSNT